MSARIRTEELSPDEVRLLRAFRAMDDRARRMQLRLGRRAAEDWPRSEPVEPVIEEDEVLLLADYRTMDDVRKREIRCLATHLRSSWPCADSRPAVARQPVLRLILGGAA